MLSLVNHMNMHRLKKGMQSNKSKPQQPPAPSNMSTNSKRPHINLAPTHFKRALQKGEAAAEKVTHKLLGGCSEQKELKPSKSIDSNYSELQFAAAAPSASVEPCNECSGSNDVDFIGNKSEIYLGGRHNHGKSRFALVSLLFVCAGILHAFNANDSRLAHLADANIPLYSVVLVAVGSFLLGRMYEIFFGSRKSLIMQQSQRHMNAVSFSSNDSNDGDIGVLDQSIDSERFRLQNQQGELSYAQQIINKLYSGKQKVKRRVSKAKRFWTVLSSSDELEDKLAYISCSRELSRHLLTYQDFSKSEKLLDAKGSALMKDSTIGHCVLNNSADASFEEEGFDYIIEPMCSLRGMDLFLADDPEVEIWRQPLLIE